jgi:hypothetical protein
MTSQPKGRGQGFWDYIPEKRIDWVRGVSTFLDVIYGRPQRLFIVH